MCFFRIPQLLLTAAAILIVGTPPAHSACNIINGVAYGDCEGVTVNNESKGILNVNSYVSESGIIAGANILAGGSLHLSGISNGDIHVSNGARLIINGVVNGVVINNGGSVEIEGRVFGVVTNSGVTTIGGVVSFIDGPGKVIYRSGAVVNGIVKE